MRLVLEAIALGDLELTPREYRDVETVGQLYRMNIYRQVNRIERERTEAKKQWSQVLYLRNQLVGIQVEKKNFKAHTLGDVFGQESSKAFTKKDQKEMQGTIKDLEERYDAIKNGNAQEGNENT